jgi:3-hydroxybutyryl-CoA dehydrogenase
MTVTSGTSAAIIGAGLMGHGIAQALAAGGCTDVRVHDPVPEALNAAVERVSENLGALGLDPKLVDRISLHDDIETAVDGVQFVFEAAPEKMELKQSIFKTLDKLTPAGVVLASNTSVMSITEIASQSENRGRIVGTHWWNPAYLIDLVEVIQADDSDVEVVERTIEFLAAVGKTPVHVKRDVAGFVGNRLQHAMWREAFNLVDEGVCDAETVDTVIKAGFGARLPEMGPVETADLVGLDLTLAIHEYILPRLDPPSEPSKGLRDRVDSGDLGMKTGKGFFQWTPESAHASRNRLRDYLMGKHE